MVKRRRLIMNGANIPPVFDSGPRPAEVPREYLVLALELLGRYGGYRALAEYTDRSREL